MSETSFISCDLKIMSSFGASFDEQAGAIKFSALRHPCDKLGILTHRALESVEAWWLCFTCEGGRKV